MDHTDFVNVLSEMDGAQSAVQVSYNAERSIPPDREIDEVLGGMGGGMADDNAKLIYLDDEYTSCSNIFDNVPEQILQMQTAIVCLPLQNNSIKMRISSLLQM